MDNKPLVSIVVPVHNESKALKGCIRSIVDQTYTNIEILVIDDGSTDGSREIAKKYAEVDERVRVISQANKGVSSARNRGLKESKGDYVMFVDGDDEIDTNACQVCIDSMGGRPVDYISFSVQKVDEAGRLISAEGGSDGSTKRYSDNKSLVENMLQRSNIRIIASLIRRKSIGLKRFDASMRIHEDVVFVFDILDNLNHAIIINRPMYRYISRPGSAMKKYIPGDIEDVQKHHNVVKKFIANNHPSLDELAHRYLMVVLFNMLVVAMYTKNKQEARLIRQKIRSNRREISTKYRFRKSHLAKFLISYLPTKISITVLDIARNSRRVKHADQ